MKKKKNSPICLFHDSILYKSDLSLLSTPHMWLNDNCILFWQQVLEHIPPFLIDYEQTNILHSKLILHDINTKKQWKTKGRFIFLQPAVAFSLQYIDIHDLLIDTSDNIFKQLRYKSLILIPLVSDADPIKGRGSHWSLLAVQTSCPEVMFLFDSCIQNIQHVSAVATLTSIKIAKILDYKKLTKVLIVEKTPQQTDSSSCGLFLCANALAILKAFENSVQQNKEELFHVNNIELPQDISYLRQYIKKLALHYLISN